MQQAKESSGVTSKYFARSLLLRASFVGPAESNTKARKVAADQRLLSVAVVVPPIIIQVHQRATGKSAAL